MKAYHKPTMSQEASAQLHLSRQAEWRPWRNKDTGVWYVSIISGSSNHCYVVRADAMGCSCPWYQNTGTTCSHMIALRRSDLVRPTATVDLATEAEMDAAFAGVRADSLAREEAIRNRTTASGTRLIKTYSELFPAGDD